MCHDSTLPHSESDVQQVSSTPSLERGGHDPRHTTLGTGRTVTEMMKGLESVNQAEGSGILFLDLEVLG